MKLLFDNNLSHKLIEKLSGVYPNSTHVMVVNLDESEDDDIWKFAKENDFTIVTKDADFNEMSLIKGFPPKIIWIRIGNCRIVDIENIIRNNNIDIDDFYHKQDSGIIEID